MTPRSHAVLAIISVLSGAAALVFETVWFHRAGLVFGSSVWSTTLVLSSFMAGLALGGLLIAVVGPRIRRVVLWYAAAETVVAATGVVLTYALPSLRGAASVAELVGSAWTTNLARFGAAFLILLIPSTAMGTTLPLLAAALARGRQGLGAALGWIYGWNTFGAVVGVLGAELWLVRQLGVGGSAWIAATLCLAAAVAAFGFAAFGAGRPQPSPAMQGDLRNEARQANAAEAIVRPVPLLLSSFLSGAALLALEVVWFRFLTMFVLSTTLAATVMLAVVLTAIAAGGLAGSLWLKRSPGASRHVPAIAFAAGIGVAVGYAGFDVITTGTQIAHWRGTVWLACALTAPTSFASGLLFTLTGAALDRSFRTEARTAASLALANTAGSAGGPLLAAFALLPSAGVEGAFFAGTLAYGVIGLLAASAFRPPRAVIRSAASIAAGAGIAAAVVLFPHGRMTGVYFPRVSAPYSADGSSIVAAREGPSETILLMDRKWMGEPLYTRLVTNGFSMSGTATPALRYMRYFVYWPMVVHAGPIRDVLVICYGVGVTAGAARDLPGVASIDVVEISSDVVAMSDVIYDEPRHPLRDARVRVHVEDGRHFLQTTTRRFDLITGEPPPPRTPGAVNIYTREYFQLIYDRLAEGGISTYWLPVGRPDPGTNVNAIMRAFCDVFADCTLWNATPFDLMLAGTRGALRPIPEDDFVRPWTVPSLRSKLTEIGLELPQQVGATFVGDAAFVRELAGSAPPLVDDYPHRLLPAVLGPSISDPGYGSDPAVTSLYQSAIDPERARRAFEASSLRSVWPARVAAATFSYFEHQQSINMVLWQGGQPLRDIATLDRLLTESPLRTLPLWMLGSDATTEAIARRHDDGSGGVMYVRGLTALANRDFPGAVQSFVEAERRGSREPAVRPLLAYALCRAGRTHDARPLVPAAPAGDEQRFFWNWLREKFGLDA